VSSRAKRSASVLALLSSLLLACRGSDTPRVGSSRSDDAMLADDSGAPGERADGSASVDARGGTSSDASASSSTGAGAAPPAAFACLAEHYAGRAIEIGGAGWSLELPDGTRVPHDDGRTKTAADRIASPDVEDIFALGYPTGPIVPVTDPEHDPGRVRLEPLFRATYGANAHEVSAALVPVKLARKTVRFHRRAAPALERVAARIDALLQADPTLDRYFRDLGGTFATRTIAGTDRTSAHAWGIAIDIDTSQADYWRNGPKRVWRNRIPSVIVDAFEAEGFVWGGRWFHHDTMHFEYRPELFDPRCRSAG